MMADGAGADECDGVFTHKDTALDEVDSAKTVALFDQSHTIQNYFLDYDDVTGDASWKTVMSNKLRMVHRGWGKRVSHLVEEDAGHLGLLTVQHGYLNEKSIKTLGHLIDKTYEGAIHLLRYGDENVLVHFSNEAVYNSFAADLDTIRVHTGCTITQLEAAYECNPPKCYIEVRTGEGESLHQLLTDTVLPFSSAFAFTTICNQPGLQSCDLTRPTSLAVTMLFDGANQLHAFKASEILTKSPWQAVNLPESVSRDLDLGTRYFVQGSDSVPMWGIQDGCVQSGIQLSIFVRDGTLYPEMQQFYNKVLGVKPFCRQAPSGGMRYTIYALSSRAELVLAHHSDFSTQRSDNLSLCVQVVSVPEMEGLKRVAPGYWHISDPEGNSVHFFTVLK